MNYYFFAASLPMLSLESAPLLSFEKFLELCEEHLCVTDLRTLDELMEFSTEKSSHRFVREWRRMETMLRNALVKIRAARLRRDASTYLKEQEGPSTGSGQGFDTYAEKKASDAFSKDNPMDRELALDRFRWSQIEDIAGYDPFSSYAILAYALKLRLAERWAAMDEQRGKEKVEEIVNQGVAGNSKD